MNLLRPNFTRSGIFGVAAAKPPMEPESEIVWVPSVTINYGPLDDNNVFVYSEQLIASVVNFIRQSRHQMLTEEFENTTLLIIDSPFEYSESSMKKETPGALPIE